MEKLTKMKLYTYDTKKLAEDMMKSRPTKNLTEPKNKMKTEQFKPK